MPWVQDVGFNHASLELGMEMVNQGDFEGATELSINAIIVRRI